jgi:hypothetical protein
MPTIPTTGKKKTITKKEVKELYYNLNQTFDLIGKKTNGESWEQLKNCYTSCNLIDVLSDLIKNNFFDLFSYDGAINQMDDRQKDALLKGAVNFQAVARKIAEKAPLIVKSVFNETFFSHDEIINYNFPAKFLIPKDQFNYVLKTGKRWVDRKPNAEYGGMIISKSHTYFQFVETRLPMMLVGDNPNLVGYFELLSIFKEKFKAEEWEIDIWLFFVQPKELAALKNNDIDSSGYVYLYQ